MALSRHKKNNLVSDSPSEPSKEAEVSEHHAGVSMRTTAPKGRPTPKRSSKTPQRGPVVPAPLTSAQARSRRKALAGPKLTRQQRQAQKAARRQKMDQRRQRMLAGEESVLTLRDRGPIRRFARDVVDARYNLLGLFLPTALVLFFTMLVAPSAQVQTFISLAMIALMVAMIIDSIILGVIVVHRVNVQFPHNTENRVRLALYAAGRASTMRRMRVPRPQVPHGRLWGRDKAEKA